MHRDGAAHVRGGGDLRDAEEEVDEEALRAHQGRGGTGGGLRKQALTHSSSHHARAGRSSAVMAALIVDDADVSAAELEYWSQVRCHSIIIR